MVFVYFLKKKQYRTSKRDFYCATFCLILNNLTKALGIDFKSAVLKLNYQRFSLQK